MPDLRGGGAERLYIYLANDWVEKGFSVEFILMKREGELLSLVSPKVNIISLNVNKIRNIVIPLSKQIRHLRPDVIITAMWPLTSITFISWLISGKKSRLYLTEHTHLSIYCVEEIKVSLFIVKMLIRMTYPYATGIITVSQGVKEDLLQLGKLNDEKIKVIYNPAAIGIIPCRESIQIRNKLWGEGFRYHILAVGSLKTQKDHKTLIRAIKLLPPSFNAKLIILGEGYLRKELTVLIDKLGLNDRVSMPGFFSDPHPWFQSADLFVLSSQWEGFGNVIVEALEFGVPVVSTNCKSGPNEILENGRYGRLVPIKDPEALASAITDSLSESHDRELLKKRAQNFTVRSISDQYLTYCLDVES